MDCEKFRTFPVLHFASTVASDSTAENRGWTTPPPSKSPNLLLGDDFSQIPVALHRKIHRTAVIAYCSHRFL